MENLTISEIYRVFTCHFQPDTRMKPEIGRQSSCFAYYITGSAKYIFKNSSFSVSAGGLIYLAKGSAYHIHVTSPTDLLCVNFDFSGDDVLPASTSFHHPQPGLVNLFELLQREWLKQGPCRRAVSLSCLYRILAEAIRCRSTPYRRVASDYSMVLDCLLEHYTEMDFSIAKLAELTDKSEVMLRRMFSAVVGISPKRYMIHLRLEKAKILLTSSNLPVSKVSRDVGFEDQYYFSRLFKEEVGLPPSRYRLQAKACL